MMRRKEGFRLAAKIAGSLAWLAGMSLFYWKYIPLIPGYQAALAPILVLLAATAWWNERRGTLLFIALFPLVNGLPYFFGLAQELWPMAPAALMLFLAYFTGLLGGRWAGRSQAGAAGEAPAGTRAFFALVAVSAVVTAFRYANFFPLFGGTIYELKVNAFGVTAGGAIMSVVFQSLDYLTGIAFFFIFLRIGKHPAAVGAAARWIALGTIVSGAFALFQKIFAPTLGCNPATIQNGLVNGTMKDAMSLGAFASMAAPLMLAAAFAFRTTKDRVLFAAAGLWTVAMVILSGSKISILSEAVVIGATGCGIAILRLREGRRRKLAGTLGISAAVVAAAAVILGLVLFIRSDRSGALKMGEDSLAERFQNSKSALIWRAEALWKPALKMLGAYPLTGVGVGGYIIEVSNVSDVHRRIGMVPESAENVILHVGAELGWPGILAVLFIGLSLAARIRNGFRLAAAEKGRDDRLMILGAAGGIMAFVISGTMHTYAVSYEVKYLLWLLIALVYSLTGPSGGKGRDIAGRPGPVTAVKKAALIGGLVAVTGGIHLWHSTHSLSLDATTASYGIRQEFGLGRIEATPEGREFRWSREYAGLSAQIVRPRLIVPIQSAHPDIVKRPLQVKFSISRDLLRHKKTIKEIVVTDNDWHEIVLPVEGEVGRAVVVLIEVSRTWNPDKYGVAPDTRNLGVAVGTIRFQNH